MYRVETNTYQGYAISTMGKEGREWTRIARNLSLSEALRYVHRLNTYGLEQH